MARCFSAKKSKAGKELKCGRCQQPIIPGDTYFYFSVGFRGAKSIRCKNHRPKQSELCGSKLSGAYAAIEGVEEALSQATCPNDIAEALESAASEVESVRDEYQDSYDNLGDNFQNGQPGELIQEKIDGLEEFAQTLNDAADEVRDIEFPEAAEQVATPAEPAKTEGAEESEEDDDAEAEESVEDKQEEAMQEAREKAEDALSSFSL